MLRVGLLVADACSDTPYVAAAVGHNRADHCTGGRASYSPGSSVMLIELMQ